MTSLHVKMKPCQILKMTYITLNRIHLLEGVIARQAQELEEAGQIEQANWEMQNNILLHGVPEMRGKNWSTTKEVIIKFLKEQMRISPEQVDSMMILRIH